MIDLHCHILPNIDDGPKTIEESLLMAKSAYEDGIHTIVATPHHNNGIYTNEKVDVLQYVSILNQRIQEEGLSITILPGSEIHIYADFVSDLKEKKLLTFNNQGKYVFLEFPYERIPVGAEQLIFDIQVSGYVPIIPHPERNKDFQNHPNKLYQFVKRGALTQLTASSLLGFFGKNVQSFSEKIIDHNLTHMIATDSHGLGKRGMKLSGAYQKIHKQFGSTIEEYYKDNAKRVVKGQDIYLAPPQKIERKKGLFSFLKG
ncbi:CpsB/CapC family capsule biosynthesis tyrosine phosphatase [Tepidibacillus marianensis]|uniref:tyrosine-protein phosphatase n=1 Tax=Tepidibacillus marianensis TaxID=3131995 RepID=UPI0030D002C9